MRSIWFVPAVAIPALMIANTSWSQDDFAPPTINPASTSSVFAEPAASANPDDLSLRQEYLQLVKAKAELMDGATLKKEIEAVQKNINELRALQKLTEAQQLLLSLAEEFPDSEAAVKATRILDAIKPAGARSPVFPAGEWRRDIPKRSADRGDTREDNAFPRQPVPFGSRD